MWPRPQLREQLRAVRHEVRGSGRRVAGLPVLSVVVMVLGAGYPSSASAHGPVDPSASSYLAAPTSVPAGVEAKVVDGDQRMWMRVDSAATVIVLDYRGAPYLRFSRTGVDVNQSSSMFYLNQVPAQLPPANLRVNTPPHWSGVTSGHEYGWHDGRLHALAVTALTPGTTYVGRWTIPLLVDGQRAAIIGGLQYAPNPPVVWFWPIVVALACVFAALRLRRPTLDLRVARALSLGALVSLTVIAAGQGLHGRPGVSIGQLVGFGLVLGFVGWALRRLVLGRHSWFTFFLIAGAAIWQGAAVLTVLRRGFVLLAVPAPVARAATVLALACGLSLLPIIFRIADQAEQGSSDAGFAQDIEWDEGIVLERDA